MSQELEFDIQKLLDIPRSSKIIIRGVESHFDVITSHVILMQGHLSSLLGPLMYQGAKGFKVKNEVIRDTMIPVLKHILAVCEACEYQLPPNDELMEYDAGESYIIKNDSILTLTNMIIAALEILNVVHVDLEGLTIWSEEAPPLELVDSIKTLILGIRNLGKKHNFTLVDIISAIV